jgi:flagellar basal-body rod modification protein FlgD
MLTQAGTIVGKTVTSADGLTKGVVEQVKIHSDGVIVTLESGEKVTVGEGVTVSGT